MVKILEFEEPNEDDNDDENEFKLKINHEYEKLNPPLSREELENLRISIRHDSIRTQLHVLQDGTILCGHNRYNLAKEENISDENIPYKIVDISDENDRKIYIIQDNLYRRQLTSAWRIELVSVLDKIEREKSKKQQEATYPKKGEQGFSVVENLPPHEKGKSRDKLGEKAKVSGKTYQKAIKVKEEDPELWQEVLNEERSIDGAFKTVKKIEKGYHKIEQEEKKEELLAKGTPLPEGEFNVFLADPPWRYEFSKSSSRDIENQYPTMDKDDICNIKIPSSDDSVLFLWATAPKLREALDVMKAWRFEYKTNMVWVKDKIGMGYYARNQHELILIGTKGKFSPPLDKFRHSSVISAKRTQHSKKPEEVYDIIEKMYPNHKYLELFARDNQRINWSTWGNESS